MAPGGPSLGAAVVAAVSKHDDTHPARLFGRPCMAGGQKGFYHGAGPGYWAAVKYPLLAFVEMEWNGHIETHLMDKITFTARPAAKS